MQRFESDAFRGPLDNRADVYTVTNCVCYHYCENTPIVTPTPTYMMLIWAAPLIYIDGAPYILPQASVPMLVPVIPILLQPTSTGEQLNPIVEQPNLTVAQPNLAVAQPNLAVAQPNLTVVQPTVIYRQPTWIVRQPTSIIRQLAPALRQQPPLLGERPPFALRQSPPVLRQTTRVVRHQASVSWSQSVALRSPTPGSMQSTLGMDQTDLTPWEPARGYRQPPKSLLQNSNARAAPSPQKPNNGWKMPYSD